MFVAKPRRVKRKQHAKPSPPPATTSTINLHHLPPRARSELDLSSPPPYTAICPPDHRSPPHSSTRPPHPRAAASTTNLNRPPLQPQSWTPHPRASPRLNISRTPGNEGRDARGAPGPWQASPNLEDVAHGALCDLISSKFDSIITSIDGENFDGAEEDLVLREDVQSGLRGGWGFTSREVSRGANRAISTAVVSTNYFAKANLYANSKLPPNLPPLKL